MAELLVRVVDKVNDDFYLNLQCTKRGDVIVACPDGWTWGREEMRDPAYRIIVMPNLSLADAESFLTPEIGTDPNTPSKTLKRRAFKLNIDDPSLPDEFKAFIADDKRTSPLFKMVADAKDAGVLQVAVTVDAVKDEKGSVILADGKEQKITETKTVIASVVAVEDFLALKVEKEATADPNVIGDNLAVIGP